MTVLGLIPARGGSKGIPGKNLAFVAGRPLLAWTCAAATESTRLDRVVCSTDSEEIAAAAAACGVEAPFRRPADLSGDETPMLDVVRDALGRFEDVSVVVLLQPTSPLRTAAHIDEAVERLAATGADSVVSVVEVPHAFTPGSVLRLEGDRLLPFEAGPPPTRRQDKLKLYARNGPAVLVVRADVVAGGSLYGEDCRPYPMAKLESLDVDDADDLALVDLLLRSR
jgi:CMP-N,N'-diacetyllegionaminic acid synthase